MFTTSIVNAPRVKENIRVIDWFMTFCSDRMRYNYLFIYLSVSEIFLLEKRSYCLDHIRYNYLFICFRDFSTRKMINRDHNSGPYFIDETLNAERPS